MRTSEWIVAGYLLYLVVLAWTRPLGADRRLLVTSVALADGACVWWLSHADERFGLIARDWLPGLQILIGYWLSGAFFTQPMLRAEATLAGWDMVLFRQLGVASFTRRAPRWLLECLEVAYLTVYVVVPLGFGVVYLFAPGRPVDSYWTIVLTAELACYAVLPWVQTRPPRSIRMQVDIDDRGLRVRQLNLRVLGGGSIQANTIPSGHAAGAFATALAAGTYVPPALVPLMVLAASITIASVIGRYHYGLDALLGVLVAFGAWGVRLGGSGLGP